MIKISHEVPLSLLKQSRLFNDYDYALVHLFDKYSEYYNFFQTSLSLGRTVLLDNSVFELEKSFDVDKFIYWIEKLNPTQYIIPDVLEDCKGTLDNLSRFLSKYSKGCKIGVVQGKTYEEIVRCYREVDKCCERVAISFDYSFYRELYPSSNKWMSWMMGRFILLNRLIDDKIINYSKSHHLLGISLPQEGTLYRSREFSFIESIDTSNPIVHGIKNIRYSDFGLNEKISIKLVDLISYKPSSEEMENIDFNLQKFKELWNRKAI
jgi:hypothetical protein